VTKYYGDSAFQDKVEPLPSGQRLVEVSSSSTMTGVDEPFPASIRTTKNAMSPSVVHLCHFDAARKTVGCPGF
jgi:hypothetical protein